VGEIERIQQTGIVYQPVQSVQRANEDARRQQQQQAPEDKIELTVEPEEPPISPDGEIAVRPEEPSGGLDLAI
jgi:hypothetical protein